MIKRIYWSHWRQIWPLKQDLLLGLKGVIRAQFFSLYFWPCSSKRTVPGPRSACKDIQEKRTLLLPQYFYHGPRSSLTGLTDPDLGQRSPSESLSRWSQRRGYADWHQLIRTHFWSSEGVVGWGEEGSAHLNSLARKFGILQEGGRQKWIWGMQPTRCYRKILQLP